MKKLFLSLLLVMALAVSTVAGDVQAPAFSDPPPDGKGFSVTTSVAVTNVLLSLIRVL